MRIHFIEINFVFDLHGALQVGIKSVAMDDQVATKGAKGKAPKELGIKAVEGYSYTFKIKNDLLEEHLDGQYASLILSSHS